MPRQFWTIFNLDKHEKYTIYDSRSELDDFFFERSAGSTLKMLIRWPASSAHMLRWVEKKVLFTRLQSAEIDRATSQSLTLEKLPIEIIHDILDFNENLEDVVCFSLTCRHFWHIGKHHVIRIRDGLIAKKTWAGSRIICVGDAQEDGDWPPSIPEEEYKSYDQMHDWPDRNDDCWPLPRNYYGRSWLVNPVEKIVMDYCCRYYRLGNTYVLRNLSKKLYVAQDQLKKIFEGCDITPQSLMKITLGHVALAYICWSSHPSMMDYTGPIHRGTWAGDRLEMVPIAEHIRELKKEEEEEAVAKIEDLAKGNDTLKQGSFPENSTGNMGRWTNVFDEFQELIQDIWEAKYGANWREYAIELKKVRWRYWVR